MPAKKSSLKPFAIIHHFPGGTKKQYAASVAAVHPGKSKLPKGQIFHAAGPSSDGWTIVAIHESKKSWEQFRDGILMPRMQKGIKVGFNNPPQESQIAIQNLQV